MDAVYVCRSGQNFELRFSLRSLAAFVPHGRVHIVGGWPPWVDRSTVQTHLRSAARTKYATTTAHVRYACEHPDVSDPFMLWNDDFYAIRPVAEPGRVWHRGTLEQVVQQYRGMCSAWADGLRATAARLAELLPDRGLYSYELHVPLVVHKGPMLHALQVAESMRVAAPHKRTLYGNLAGLRGERLRDPKVTQATGRWPDGDWLSSDDAGFSRVVAPRLKVLFPDAGRYEIRSSSSRGTRSGSNSGNRSRV